MYQEVTSGRETTQIEGMVQFNKHTLLLVFQQEIQCPPAFKVPSRSSNSKVVVSKYKS